MVASDEVKKNGKDTYYQRKTWVNIFTGYLRLLLMRFSKINQFLVNLSQKFLSSLQKLENLHKLPYYHKT